MPEFHLQVSDYRAFEALPAIARGFIEAAFFTEESCYSSDEWADPEVQDDVREGRADGCIPCGLGFDALHADSVAIMVEFCAGFQNRAAPLLELAYATGDYDEEQAGRDLWFTFNGHGVGFWDRKQLGANGLGDALSEACGSGEWSLWFGDHVAYGDAPFIHASY